MSDLRKAAQQALEALENVRHYDKENLYGLDDDITALRAALAQEPEPVQEPAYKVKVAGRWHDAEPFAPAFSLPDGEHLLYTTPPQRPPLTDEEIAEVYLEWDAAPGRSMADFARAIERKVRGE